MKTERLHQQNPSQAATDAESRGLLRSYRIDPTARMSLETAAASVGMVSDEILAQMDAAARRAARRARRVERHEEEYELELV